MKTAVFFTAIAGASAFAPINQPAGSVSQLSAASLDSLPGRLGPETAGKVFDPLDLAQWAPVDFLRKAELSNGRSAMLATVGWVFPKFAGTFEGPIDTTDPVAAFWQADPQWWAQFLLICGVAESFKYRGEIEGKSYMGEPTKDAVVDYSNQWGKMNAAAREDIATKELKNGRLAMIGIASFAANYFIPGSVPGLPEGF